MLGVNGHPSNASVQTKSATNILGTLVARAAWQATRCMQSRSATTTSTGPTRRCRRWWARRSTISRGSPSARPTTSRSIPKQNNFEGRYDLNWHKSTHDIKIGVEYMHVRHTGDWYIQASAATRWRACPSNLGALIPADAALDPSQWNLSGLSSVVTRDRHQNYSYTRLGEHHRLAAADVCDLVRRQLARQQAVDRQLRCSLGRGSEHGVGAEHQDELDPRSISG